MKKTSYLLLTVFMLISVINTNAQISKPSCSNFKNYKSMVEDRTNLTKKEFFDIIAYGNTKGEAIYNAKIEVLKHLTGNQKYLNNPMGDSIINEFAGEMAFLKSNEYVVKKTRFGDKKNGKFKCQPFEIYYNKDLTDYLQYHMNNFIKYSVAFVVNPKILETGDKDTKELYNKSIQRLRTAMLSAKFKFDNVVNIKQLKLAKLPECPDSITPCDGYKVCKTNNVYADLITRIKHNEGNSRQIDVIFSIDTITITPTDNPQNRKVTFHVTAYNANTATYILEFDSQDVQKADNDYDATDLLLDKSYGKNKLSPFARDVEAYMYQIIKRYSSYTRDGMLFSLKICKKSMTIEQSEELEEALLDCKLIADASISSGSWSVNGASIGYTYEARSYLLDRLRLKINLRKLLKAQGLKNFNIHPEGTSFIITPSKKGK